MTRITAREIAVITVYEMDYSDSREDLIAERLESAFYERLRGEDELFAAPPDPKQAEYIRRVTEGVLLHLPELDAYIDKYAVGWKFSRLARISVAIMRVAMFETLYMSAEVPAAAAINAAVEISKKYETSETTAFVNGVLGTFVRSEIR
ncbi:MAG: transcription antitermination factor NusB [Oscillospiraceae bacterium]|jgi:N utilization substance protein B|nr:transcription antitermination factor NusB [Oscillospiraceae bacterium]